MYFDSQKMEQLESYTTILDKGFLGQDQYYKRFAAINALKYNKEPDVAEIKNLMKYMKQNTKLFSPFRNNVFMLASLLYLGNKKPEQTFIRVRDHLDLLKQNGFKQSQFLPMMSYALDSLLFDKKIQDMAIQTESYRVGVVEKANEVYGHMKLNHPWITGGDDYALSLLIAHANKDVSRMESIYQSLNLAGLKSGNALQSLANILSLADDEDYILVEKTMALIQICKDDRFKVNQTMYPGIGLLALVDNEANYMEQAIELTRELKKMKMYKWLDKNLLFMFAVTLIGEDIKHDLSGKTIMETTISVTIEQLVMAQTAIILAAIAASSIATAST